MAGDSLRGAWLVRQLHPAHVMVLPRVRSTNLFAAGRVEAGRLSPPALVAASRQTGGRGQRDNVWWSDRGSLCATLVLPARPDHPPGSVPLRAGLAVAAVLARHLPRQNVQVKWPNDILVGGKKLAGLLCARIRETDLIGIGLNVSSDLLAAPPEVRIRAETLQHAGAGAVRRDVLLAEIWDAVMAERSVDAWIDRYHQGHLLHQQRLRVEGSGDLTPGLCIGVDEQGRLLLETSDGLRRITEGTPVRAA